MHGRYHREVIYPVAKYYGYCKACTVRQYVSDPRLTYTVGYGGYTVAGVLYSRKARKRDTSENERLRWD